MIDRPSYLSKYTFNWETFDIIVGGKSSLDAKNYMNQFASGTDVEAFLNAYGFDMSDPVQSAELFGIFQEAIEFIRRYFLKDGNPEGLDFKVPSSFYTIVSVSDLFMMTAGSGKKNVAYEDSIWASIILKVMHTILHADKDLRYRYFTTIQKQIFDRFYKYMYRDEKNQLFLRNEHTKQQIKLVEFETKAKKSRDSIIIKLLHKQENVAEELFDRIGVRFITETKVDTLQVLKFLYQNDIIVLNNIKPSRSINSLFDLKLFKAKSYYLLKRAIKEKLSEEDFLKALNEIADSCVFEETPKHQNQHSSRQYSAIHFTCRQMIKYKNPFFTQYNELRKLAKNAGDNELAEKILNLDTSSIARDVRFFYPFEVQITDIEGNSINTAGEASHQEYKKSQVLSAMRRIFAPLIEYKS